MWKLLKWVWVVALLITGTTVGAMYGWMHHGWVGAIMLGFVGFAAGAVLASSPMLLLQILA
ncbi:hypothetical protein ACTJKE_09410 [Ensifer sp. 22521]|uniref:hypothetical protein n=1 Tax=Ensifer sp. 22521 TaxID=3453935 RepID=UPI003F86CD74